LVGDARSRAPATAARSDEWGRGARITLRRLSAGQRRAADAPPDERQPAQPEGVSPRSHASLIARLILEDDAAVLLAADFLIEDRELPQMRTTCKRALRLSVRHHSTGRSRCQVAVLPTKGQANASEARNRAGCAAGGIARRKRGRRQEREGRRHAER